MSSSSPYINANWNTVRPFSFCSSTLAPRSSSSWTISECTLPVARCNGVQRPWAFAFTLAPRSTNKRAMSKCPYDDAECNGVQPILSLRFVFAPKWISISATSRLPLFDAICSGVWWNTSLSLGSAPWPSNDIWSRKVFPTT